MSLQYAGGAGWIPKPPTTTVQPPEAPRPTAPSCHNGMHGLMARRVEEAVAAAQAVLDSPWSTTAALRGARTTIGLLTGAHEGVSTEHGTPL